MNRRHFLASVGAAATAIPSASQSRKPPNLLFLMADQLRFGALSCTGNKVVETPHLDRLAREGTRFENAMCACPVRVPSRTGMLTGKSMANSGVRGNLAVQDAAFEPKMAHVLHVYKEVEIVNDYLRGSAARPLGMVTISYDEKPGIQALAVTTPDRHAVLEKARGAPDRLAALAEWIEYKAHPRTESSSPGLCISRMKSRLLPAAF